MKKLFLSVLVMLTLIGATNSQIVYTDLSSNPIKIDGTNSEYELNFMEGETEFIIQNYSSLGDAVFFASFLSGSAVVSTKADYNANVDALMKDTEIGESSTFFGFDDQSSPYFNILYLPDVYYFGVTNIEPSQENVPKFVGFKFVNNGNTYYGWAEISLKSISTKSGQVEVLLNGYAYQSKPNTPIKAGDIGSVSLEDIVKNSTDENIITVYPNPVNEKITISCSTKIDRIEIVNVLGQKIFTESKNIKNIDVSSFDKGVYYINIMTEEKNIVKKFIKQ